MKITTVILAILVVAGIVLWKFRVQVKDFFARRAAAASATAPGTPAPGTPGTGGKKMAWLAKYFWTIVLVVAGLAIFYFGMYTPTWDSPSLASTVAWARAHWLAVLALSGIIYALTSIFAKAMKEVGEGVQWMLTASLFMLFIGFPIWVWLVEPSSKPVASVSAPATASAPSKATMLTMEPGGKSEHIRVPFQNRVLLHGRDYRYHCVYGDGHEESFLPGDGHQCADGDIRFVYASNIRYDLPNVVRYSVEVLQ